MRGGVLFNFEIRKSKMADLRSQK